MLAEKALNSTFFKKNYGTNCIDMFKIEFAFKFDVFTSMDENGQTPSTYWCSNTVKCERNMLATKLTL